MNLLGRTFKIVNWVLFGEGKKLITYAEYIAEHVEVEVTKDGATIRFKKEF